MITEQAATERRALSGVSLLPDRNRAAASLYGSDPVSASTSSSPRLPAPRGPISDWLVSMLRRTSPTHTVPESVLQRWVAAIPGDSAVDDDAQIALFCIYGLSYRGFHGVDDVWEWDRDVLALRRALEVRFERDLRDAVDDAGLVRGRSSVAEVLDACAGPSLSGFMSEEGTREHFAEFCIHRSAYQLKEADPHTWGIPRLTGPRKAAFVEIQADEYGNGRPGHSHAELFADLLRAQGIDARFGAHIDRLPAFTLATDNLVTMFGTHRRLRSALLGHLAGFEMTSVGPMSRYALAADRLGLGPAVRRFYDVHVEADAHHGDLAATTLVGGDPEADGLSTPEILFGTAALSIVEERFARGLLEAWSRGATSLRSPAVGALDRPISSPRFGHVA